MLYVFVMPARRPRVLNRWLGHRAWLLLMAISYVMVSAVHARSPRRTS